MEDQASVRFLHRLGLTEEMVRNHVIRPDHLKDATLHIEHHEAGDRDCDPSSRPSSGLLYRLNTEKLNRDLHDLLSGCVAGYSMQLRQHGRTIWDRQWRSARMPNDTPNDPGTPWTSHVPMHVASVSKLITAMAMTKLLHSRNISPDARIAPWLPPYWPKGPGVDRITFRQLLTHTSGLVLNDEAGPSDFESMKEQIRIGVVGKPGYRNMNFGLCRILIATIDAPYLYLFGLFDMFGLSITDAFWDIMTIRHYERYVSENIFAPAGVTATLVHTGDHALAYPLPDAVTKLVAVPGWDSGDLSTWSGGVGWHLSVNDLLSVMAAFRRGGAIVDPARATTMLDNKFGLDACKDTPLGRIYMKGGYWSKDSTGTHVEQSNTFFLPKGMELVVLANSPFCKPNHNFRDQALKAIEDNIQINRSAIAVAAAGAFAGLALVSKTLAVIIRR